jgi:hypothetical protein
MLKSKNILLIILIFTVLAAFAYAAPPQQAGPPPIVLMRWVSLSSDAPDTVREIIRSEVDSREGFSTTREERANIKAVEDEKERDDADYKNLIITSNKEFVRAKKKRDDTTTQFQSTTTELEESAKGVKTIRATIENLDGQIDRYDQDIKTQQDSLKRWLVTEKQGEVLVAVIYTRGFKDSEHELASSADQVSAPLIATHMGTFISSFTKVINNITDVDFIRATEEGTAKWNNEEPLRVELDKGEKGTTYLRLKRYELYPFQENKSGTVKAVAGSTKYKVAIVKSRKDLDTFMTQNLYPSKNYELDRIDRIISETNQSNKVAEEGLHEQVKSFQDRIRSLQDKAGQAKSDKESQKMLLKRKEESYYKMSLDVAAIREKKDTTERQFHEAQAALQEKKRLHESIIIKTALASTKGSQTPAEASAEAILDKLSEVKNDAKTQHSTSTTEVTNFRVSGESSSQSITEARIIALRLISFINEGESVRVKMAFRVKTVLDEKVPVVEPLKTPSEPPVTSSFWGTKPEPAPKPEPKTKSKTVTKPEPKPEPIAEPVQEKVKKVVPFKRNYKYLATKDALGCLFDLRSVSRTKDGLQVIIEVVNTDEEVRKVAFYDEKFGSWPRSKIFDSSNKYYETAMAYILRGSQKTMMYEIDSRGHGIEIAPQTSVTMGLIFKNVPANTKTLNLHPFIYYGSRWSWQEFDLPMPMPNSRISAPSPSAAPARAIKKR